MSSPQAALQQVMNHVLADTSRRVYAVLDGARFDDLPFELSTAQIAHRSLYRNVQDIELVRAGPWLVDPYHGLNAALNVWGGIPADERGLSPVATDTVLALGENAGSHSTGPVPFHASGGRADPAKQLEQTLAISGDLPAAILWIGGSTLTEAALWRHLRTINMALIPKEYVEDTPVEVRESLRLGSKCEEELAMAPVMFRHADGNVLAQVLPALDTAQFSRFFGPAKEAVFLAPDNPSQISDAVVRRALLPENAPPAKAGLLSLDRDQCETITGLRMQALRRSAVSEFCAADNRSHSPDKEQVSDAFDRAEAYGLESKEQIWTFIELDRKFGPQFERSAKFNAVREHLEDKQLSAGAKLYLATAELGSPSKG